MTSRSRPLLFAAASGIEWRRLSLWSPNQIGNKKHKKTNLKVCCIGKRLLTFRASMHKTVWSNGSISSNVQDQISLKGLLKISRIKISYPKSIYLPHVGTGVNGMPRPMKIKAVHKPFDVKFNDQLSLFALLASSWGLGNVCNNWLEALFQCIGKSYMKLEVSGSRRSLREIPFPVASSQKKMLMMHRDRLQSSQQIYIILLAMSKTFLWKTSSCS